MSQSDTGTSGFFGKLTALGDFVTRRLPNQFVQPWDQWLRESLAASQETLGREWLDNYLTSPLWRFVLTPGIVGQTGWSGILMPSVDRVGRYFPLTLARPLPPGANPLRILGAQDWFDRAEQLALSTLDDGFEFDTFDAGILALPEAPRDTQTHDQSSQGQACGNTWQLDTGPGIQSMDVCPALLSHALEEIFFAYSLWWTRGSEQISPSLLACQGLPAPESFTALLAGKWADHGWLQLGAR